jgi:hypothetical protein
MAPEENNYGSYECKSNFVIGQQELEYVPLQTGGSQFAWLSQASGRLEASFQV